MATAGPGFGLDMYAIPKEGLDGISSGSSPMSDDWLTAPLDKVVERLMQVRLDPSASSEDVISRLPTAVAVELLERFPSQKLVAIGIVVLYESKRVHNAEAVVARAAGLHPNQKGCVVPALAYLKRCPCDSQTLGALKTVCGAVVAAGSAPYEVYVAVVDVVNFFLTVEDSETHATLRGFVGQYLISCASVVLQGVTSSTGTLAPVRVLWWIFSFCKPEERCMVLQDDVVALVAAAVKKYGPSDPGVMVFGGNFLDRCVEEDTRKKTEYHADLKSQVLEVVLSPKHSEPVVVQYALEVLLADSRNDFRDRSWLTKELIASIMAFHTGAAVVVRLLTMAAVDVCLRPGKSAPDFVHAGVIISVLKVHVMDSMVVMPVFRLLAWSQLTDEVIGVVSSTAFATAFFTHAQTSMHAALEGLKSVNRVAHVWQPYDRQKWLNCVMGISKAFGRCVRVQLHVLQGIALYLEDPGMPKEPFLNDVVDVVSRALNLNPTHIGLHVESVKVLAALKRVTYWCWDDVLGYGTAIKAASTAVATSLVVHGGQNISLLLRASEFLMSKGNSFLTDVCFVSSLEPFLKRAGDLLRHLCFLTDPSFTQFVAASSAVYGVLTRVCSTRAGAVSVAVNLDIKACCAHLWTYVFALKTQKRWAAYNRCIEAGLLRVLECVGHADMDAFGNGRGGIVASVGDWMDALSHHVVTFRELSQTMIPSGEAKLDAEKRACVHTTNVYYFHKVLCRHVATLVQRGVVVHGSKSSVSALGHKCVDLLMPIARDLGDQAVLPGFAEVFARVKADFDPDEEDIEEGPAAFADVITPALLETQWCIGVKTATATVTATSSTEEKEDYRGAARHESHTSVVP